MREAIKYAIDKAAINARLLGGNAAIATTNVSPNAWFYVAPTAADVQDLDKAAAALAAGGWVTDPNSGFLFKDVDGDGVKDYSKGDYDAKIEACTTTRQLRQDTLAMVSGFLNQIGVQVVISPVSASDIFATYNESTDQTPCALSRGNYDVALHAFSVPLDPISNYPVYHSSQFEPNGSNDGKVNDPGIDTALDNTKNTIDFNVVMDNMATFQQIYQDQTVEIPLYFRKEVYLQNPALQNFTGNPTSTGPLWNVQHWFFNQ
jgi:ABC-type transport system substrate-binding protein